MTRRSLRRFGRILIGVMLYGQMAIAAYACPGLAAMADTSPKSVPTAQHSRGVASGDATGAAMPGCHDMGNAPTPQVSKLCAEHCQFGQQGNQAPTLTVPTVLLTALYFTPPVPEPAAPSHAVVVDAATLVAASPPHAILHCCFRI